MIEIKFQPYTLKYYFNTKVREACRSCKRFGNSSQCPPRLPSIKYFKKALTTYRHGLIIYKKFTIDHATNWERLGKSSSMEIWECLLKKRKELLDAGHVFITCFGAGSCKLCPSCTNPCSKPALAITPIEGCGIDVVKLVKPFGIDIKFPVEKQGYFFRIGMILWD